MNPRPAPPPTVSLRLLQPYVRLRDAVAPRRDLSGVTSWLVQPDLRIAHDEAIALMLSDIEREQNPARGLHAARLVEPWDRDSIEQAAAGAPTLGEAFARLARYFPLLSTASELTVDPGPEYAAISYAVVRGSPEPPAFADSVIAGLVYFVRRTAHIDERDWTLTFTQARPTYAEEYARFFAGRVEFAAPRNALLLPTSQLALPMPWRSPTLTRAHEVRADELLADLAERDTTTARVRALVREHLGEGVVTMTWVADQLALSVPTLRRYLAAEGTSFRTIVADVRRVLAERTLRDGSVTIGELAAQLGFANLGAFDRAFKRWSGAPPSSHRAKAPGVRRGR